MINNFRVGNLVKFNCAYYAFNDYGFSFNGEIGEIVKVKHYKKEGSYRDFKNPFHSELWIILNGDKKVILTTESFDFDCVISDVFDNKESVEVLYG